MERFRRLLREGYRYHSRRDTHAYAVYWGSGMAFMGVAALAFAVTGRFVWATFALGAAISEALVFVAGLRYGKGTFRNVWRLVASFFAKPSS